MLSAPERGTPIANPDGTVGYRLSAWIQSVTNLLNDLEPAVGSGTPEAAVIAPVGKWYVDQDAAVGTGIYFKATGTGATGWVLRS